MKLLIERLFLLATYQLTSGHMLRMTALFPWMLSWPRLRWGKRVDDYDVILTCNYSPWSRYSGGGQKSVHMLAGEMARQGLSVAAVYSKAPWERIAPHADTEYAVHWAGFFALCPGISSPLRFLNGILFYFKVRSLSSCKTIIHGNGDEASLLWLVRDKRKFIYSNRYPEFPAFLSGRDWTRKRTWLAVFLREPRFVAMAMGLRNADTVTLTSAYSLAEVSKAFGLDPAGLATVPNGVDPLFLALPMEPQPGRGVLFFGRLTRAKGADLALEGYARLPAALRAAHPLRIIGSGPICAALQARAESLGLSQVEFPGWKSGGELARLIVSSAAICLPSREESFGNAVVEALALGRTLVSTRCGSIPEVAGSWASLADSQDPMEMAARLEVALRGERPLMDRCRQRESIRSSYSWSRTAIRFRAIYFPVRISKPKRMNGMIGHTLGVG